LLWLFCRWSLLNYLPGWPQTTILLILYSQVARITGMSHWHPAQFSILLPQIKPFFVPNTQLSDIGLSTVSTSRPGFDKNEF
jgi:hypothetical protein